MSVLEFAYMSCLLYLFLKVLVAQEDAVLVPQLDAGYAVIIIRTPFPLIRKLLNHEIMKLLP